MVGQGVLRECLAAPYFSVIAPLGRRPTRRRPIASSSIASRLAPTSTGCRRTCAPDVEGLDACFYCLGVSSGGLDEASYRKLTFDLTLGLARPLSERNPRLTIVYVSGAATRVDSPMMWARVKARDRRRRCSRCRSRPPMRCPPGVIAPAHGERSGVSRLSGVLYARRPRARRGCAHVGPGPAADHRDGGPRDARGWRARAGRRRRSKRPTS